MNRGYARIREGHIEFAPSELTIDGRLVSNPPYTEYLAQGWKIFIEDAQPPQREPPEGMQWVRDGWRETITMIYPKWRIAKIPEPSPRRWSRLTIKGTLAENHSLPAVEAYLSSLHIKPDYTAWQALTDCDYVEEGYPTKEQWNDMLDGAATALGKTREEIDSFLDSLPTEE